MFKALILTFFLLPNLPLFAKESPHRKTLSMLMGQSKDKFKISGCQKFNLNPAEIFSSFNYMATFNKNCDIQGEIALKVFLPFPIDMQIKNLSHYKKLTGTAKINLGMENPPKILAELTKAKLHGNDDIYFSAFYSGEVLPASTIKIKPGTENLRIEIFNKDFVKKLDEFTIKLK